MLLRFINKKTTLKKIGTYLGICPSVSESLRVGKSEAFLVWGTTFQASRHNLWLVSIGLRLPNGWRNKVLTHVQYAQVTRKEQYNIKGDCYTVQTKTRTVRLFGQLKNIGILPDYFIFILYQHLQTHWCVQLYHCAVIVSCSID